MTAPKDTNVHAITRYRSDGRSEFLSTADQSPPKQQVLPGIGTLQNTYQASRVPAEVVNNSSDIEASLRIRQQGLSSDRITVDGGLVTEILRLQPGGVSPLHRTRTLDFIIVIEGEVEIELDGGQKRTFGRGDTCALNGAGHRVRNVSAEGVWAKIYSVTVDAAPMKLGDRVLEETWELEAEVK